MLWLSVRGQARLALSVLHAGRAQSQVSDNGKMETTGIIGCISGLYRV